MNVMNTNPKDRLGMSMDATERPVSKFKMS
jgi:hypothetical protein